MSDGMTGAWHSVTIKLPVEPDGTKLASVTVIAPAYLEGNDIYTDQHLSVRHGDTISFRLGRTVTSIMPTVTEIKVYKTVGNTNTQVASLNYGEVFSIEINENVFFTVSQPDTSPIDDSETGNCGYGACGVRSINISMQEDGSISATVTGLPVEAKSMLHHIMMGNPAEIASGASSKKYRITSMREDGPLVTYTAISTISDTLEKIPTSAVFKTIPSEVYDLHTSDIIPRSMQNPLESPDSLIYIRPSDLYGTDGWTVQEILDILKIKAKVPAGFNYHVYQLSVSRGAPVISLMHNLLPIPGLVIERVFQLVSSEYIAAYYITVADGKGNFKGKSCKVLSSSTSSVEQKVTVVGLPGEPRYITGDTGVYSSGDITVQYNLIGGVFAILGSTVTINTSTNA